MPDIVKYIFWRKKKRCIFPHL